MQCSYLKYIFFLSSSLFIYIKSERRDFDIFGIESSLCFMMTILWQVYHIISNKFIAKDGYRNHKEHLSSQV